ncbi:MAG: FHA domain-containing protein [Kofleriaceae bacterium]|nr:FHA domain-containing protein [Myxococcales bacterium]MCB9564687.1 FHA domain-containing protein [Kofleriaceae bacterium]MCB9573924.1 FHA domain-containing protein [Kofleriaceae bacterium]
MRARFVLVYQDQRVPLPDGEVVIGRSVACQVRFNAPTVSRRHLVLRIDGDQLTVDNLSQSTGTLLNGRRVTGPTPVQPGDELTLGPREVRIERLQPGEIPPPPRPAPALGLLPDGDDDEITETFEVPEVAALMAGATLEYHTCPRCRTRVGFDVTTCTACGHVWPADVPSSRLGQVTSRDVVDDIPMPASVMAVYSSDAMTVDVTITELRKDGLFIPTELLDAPGTPCEVTLLPDGQAPLAIQAEVTSVRGAVIGGAPPGLDVRFTRMSDGVGLWIELWLRAHQRRGTGG